MIPDNYVCEGQTSIFDFLNDDALDMGQVIYMLVSCDKYEFPIYVCDSVEELAAKSHKSVGYINDCIAKAEKRGGRSQYVRVRI